jgi:triosephosphate isomerase
MSGRAVRKIIAANWKMNKTVAEALAFADEFAALWSGQGGVEVVICPPFTALYPLGQRLQGSGLLLGAQDLFWEERGAFTGEVAAFMLREAGASHVIVGHSERRHLLGESDADVRRKLQRALQEGLYPILCVGETLPQREGGEAEAVVCAQLRAALQGCPPSPARLLVAYEPVWAIGTGRNAEPADARHMALVIRRDLESLLGRAGAEVRVLYGGSVTPDNVAGYTGMVEMDGALVGGASLRPESLAAIVRRTEEAGHAT